MIEKLSSSKEYMIAYELGRPSCAVFSGFEESNETDEAIKGRGVYKKLVLFAEESKARYRELKERGVIEELITAASTS